MTTDPQTTVQRLDEPVTISRDDAIRLGLVQSETAAEHEERGLTPSFMADEYPELAQPTERHTAEPFADDVSRETSADDEPADDERPDLDELAESLNGYDQLAIRTMFGITFDQVEEDMVMFMRAMAFVHYRREAGAQGPKNDKEAYRRSMELTMRELVKVFRERERAGVDAVAESDHEFADFIMATGLSYTHAQFMALTVTQRAAIVNAARKKG